MCTIRDPFFDQKYNISIEKKNICIIKKYLNAYLCITRCKRVNSEKNGTLKGILKHNAYFMNKIVKINVMAF